MSVAALQEARNLETLSDAELVVRVRQGETPLFELIMRRFNRRLFRIARGILGNDADAEDAVQDAYVSAFYKLHQFRGPDGFATWLCRIATNEARMRRRRSHSRVMLDAGSAQMDELPAPQRSNPLNGVHELQLRQLLERAIDALPDTYRETFVLREVEEMPVADVAQCLDIEQGAVKTRVHRARRLLQKSLNNEMSSVLTDVFHFGGARCDRIVEAVFRRLNTGS
jgi:RNA polymerase sigma-70 factor (ECF subfamily)